MMPPSRSAPSSGHSISSFEIDMSTMAGMEADGLLHHYNGSHPPRRRFLSDRCLLYASLSTSVALLVALVAVLVVTTPNNPSTLHHWNSVKAVNPRTETIDRDVDPQWRVRPTNLHVAMLGDSITHYQYLSLAYFLRTGRWFDPSYHKSHLTNVYSFHNIFHDDIYGEYFFQTTRLLQPYEICDCYYPKGLQDAYRMAPHQVIINRYFHDPIRNNTLRFFHSFGHEHEMQGRIKSENITDLEGKNQDGLLGGVHAFQQADVKWSSKDWGTILQTQLNLLHPKPDYVVLNAGKHSTEFATDPAVVTSLQTALKQVNDGRTKAFWRTTTYRRGGAYIQQDNPQTDATMCKALGGCLDVSWTKKLKEQLYWDELHNNEPVYRVMNEEFLEQIGYLPNGYVKYNRTLLLK